MISSLILLALLHRPNVTPRDYLPYGSKLPQYCATGDVFDLRTGSGYTHWECVSTNSWSQVSSGASVQAGSILLTLSSCPSGYSEVAALDGVTLIGTIAAHGNVGGTGGSDNITPTGTNSALTFTGSSGVVPAQTISWPVSVPTLTMNSYTPTGTNGTVSITPLGSITAWPAGVPTAADESSHTHGVGSYGAAAQTFTGTPSSCVANHVHVENGPSSASGGLVGWTPDASTSTSTASGYSTANPTGGSATCTPAGTNGTSAVTGTSGAGSAHTHTITWPGTFPTFTGSLTTVGAETFTGNAAVLTGTNAWPASVPTNGTVNFTPAGTINTPAFTGNSFDNRSAFVRVIFCQKN